MEDLLLHPVGTPMTKPFNSGSRAVLRLLASGLCLMTLVSCSNDFAAADPTSTASTTSSPPSATVPVTSAGIREVVPHYATDVTDLRRLAGLADAVFVGTVSEQDGTFVRYGHTNTRFKVKVQLVLKGSPATDVIVEQEGGRDLVKNITYVVKGDTPLEAGATYVLSAMYRENENLYSIIPIYGNARLTDEEAKELAAGKSPKPVADMREAIAHQIAS